MMEVEYNPPTASIPMPAATVLPIAENIVIGGRGAVALDALGVLPPDRLVAPVRLAGRDVRRLRPPVDDVGVHLRGAHFRPLAARRDHVPEAVRAPHPAGDRSGGPA